MAAMEDNKHQGQGQGGQELATRQFPEQTREGAHGDGENANTSCCTSGTCSNSTVVANGFASGTCNTDVTPFFSKAGSVKLVSFLADDEAMITYEDAADAHKAPDMLSGKSLNGAAIHVCMADISELRFASAEQGGEQEEGAPGRTQVKEGTLTLEQERDAEMEKTENVPLSETSAPDVRKGKLTSQSREVESSRRSEGSKDLRDSSSDAGEGTGSGAREEWRCECGTRNFLSRTECRGCLLARPEDFKSWKQMWKCRKCSAANSMERLNCHACNYDFERKAKPKSDLTKEEWFCSCGVPNFMDREKCRKCRRDAPSDALSRRSELLSLEERDRRRSSPHRRRDARPRDLERNQRSKEKIERVERGGERGGVRRRDEPSSNGERRGIHHGRDKGADRPQHAGAAAAAGRNWVCVCGIRNPLELEKCKACSVFKPRLRGETSSAKIHSAPKRSSQMMEIESKEEWKCAICLAWNFMDRIVCRRCNTTCPKNPQVKKYFPTPQVGRAASPPPVERSRATTAANRPRHTGKERRGSRPPLQQHQRSRNASGVAPRPQSARESFPTRQSKGEVYDQYQDEFDSPAHLRQVPRSGGSGRTHPPSLGRSARDDVQYREYDERDMIPAYSRGGGVDSRVARGDVFIEDPDRVYLQPRGAYREEYVAIPHEAAARLRSSGDSSRGKAYISPDQRRPARDASPYERRPRVAPGGGIVGRSTTTRREFDARYEEDNSVQSRGRQGYVNEGRIDRGYIEDDGYVSPSSVRMARIRRDSSPIRGGVGSGRGMVGRSAVESGRRVIPTYAREEFQNDYFDEGDFDRQYGDYPRRTGRRMENDRVGGSEYQVRRGAQYVDEEVMYDRGEIRPAGMRRERYDIEPERMVAQHPRKLRRMNDY